MSSLHPRLRRLFEDVEQAGIRWTLLRVPSVPSAPTGDVDLLVDAAQGDQLRAVLARHDFVAVPGWEAFPTMLFVGYDDETARCLLLEVTDEVVFADGTMRTTAASGLLARSRWEAGMRQLAADDAFWALLLHSLLDKRAVPAHYRPELQTGAGVATTSSALASETGPLAEHLRGLAAAGDWPALEQAADGLARSWWARVPAVERRRQARERLQRRLQAPSLLRRRRGVSVALLGANGAGKSTLVAGIEMAWPFPVRQVYMGLWKSGDSPGSEIPVLAPLLRPVIAWVRYATGVTARLRGQLVVFDRYVHDARIPAQPPWVAAKRVYFWLLAHSVPSPDLVVLLDLPGNVAHARKDETTPAIAMQERRDYLALAQAMPSVHVIDATQSAERVRADTLRLIWDRTRLRWGG